MDKNFDSWNSQKKKLDLEKRAPLFREREIWWCSLGVNIGSEEDGKGEKYLRPIIILRKFNSSIFYGMPLTSKSKSSQFYVPLYAGGVHGSVLLSQMRLIDAKRLSYRLGKISKTDFSFVKEKLKELLFPESFVTSACAESCR